jgi:hypothetical protein
VPEIAVPAVRRWKMVARTKGEAKRWCKWYELAELPGIK